MRFRSLCFPLLATCALACQGRFTSSDTSSAASLGGTGNSTQNGNNSGPTGDTSGSAAGGAAATGSSNNPGLDVGQAGNPATNGGNVSRGGSASGGRDVGGGSAVGGMGVDSGGQGGGTFGGSSVGGDGVGGSVSDGGDGAGGNGVGGASSCDDYADVQREGPVTLHIKNETEDPIVLGPPSSCQPVSVTVESMTSESPGSFTGLHCLFTCEMSFNGVGGCTADCPFPPTIRIEPGGTYDVEWNGLVYERVDLPDACCESECGDACDLPHVAQPGSYRARIALASEEFVSNADSCPNDSSWCDLQTFVDTTDVEIETIEFELEDGAGTITVQ